ncbi:unnamed protein product, partial [Choristocarpus tenellus]
LCQQALKKFGKEWKRVASMVRTRTVVQTRTHAQKYFQKLQKAAAVGVNVGGIRGGGIDSEDGTMDLMDIEVHMNTIDPENVTHAGAPNSSSVSNTRTRGSSKRTAQAAMLAELAAKALAPSTSSSGSRRPSSRSRHSTG